TPDTAVVGGSVGFGGNPGDTGSLLIVGLLTVVLGIFFRRVGRHPGLVLAGVRCLPLIGILTEVLTVVPRPLRGLGLGSGGVVELRLLVLALVLLLTWGIGFTEHLFCVITGVRGIAGVGDSLASASGRAVSTTGGVCERRPTGGQEEPCGHQCGDSGMGFMGHRMSFDQQEVGRVRFVDRGWKAPKA